MMQEIHIQPFISGLMGGIISLLIGVLISKWTPKSFNEKSAECLLEENKASILVANLTFWIGILSTLFLYQ